MKTQALLKQFWNQPVNKDYSSVLQWHCNNHILNAVVPLSVPSSGARIEDPLNKKCTNGLQRTKMPFGMHKI